MDKAHYETSKNMALAAIENDYNNKPIVKKWQQIFDLFTTCATKQNRTEQFSKLLTDFKKDRIDTHTRDPEGKNSNNLTLAACVNYFENFYYLLTTTDNFKIDQSQQEIIIFSIL